MVKLATLSTILLMARFLRLAKELVLVGASQMSLSLVKASVAGLASKP